MLLTKGSPICVGVELEALFEAGGHSLYSCLHLIDYLILMHPVYSSRGLCFWSIRFANNRVFGKGSSLLRSVLRLLTYVCEPVCSFLESGDRAGLNTGSLCPCAQ